MSALTAVCVALGAAVGAPLRYLIDRAVRARRRGEFPWGTFTVNMIGSFGIGALTGAVAALPPETVSAPLQAALGMGFCGALTTYSTLSYETIALLEDRSPGYALANLIGSAIAGLAVAALGCWTVQAALLTVSAG